MPENETQNNAAAANTDAFVPNDEFNAQFADVEISGAEVDETNTTAAADTTDNETEEAKAERLKNEGAAGESAAELAKKKEIADNAIEEQKIAKMSPEEKEKYLAEKNKTSAAASTTAAAQVKPFEEELLSRFQGKYKTVEEIETALNNPQKVEVFADEAVKNINEYVKNGGKLDAAYLEAITTDYAAIEDGVELAMRHLQATDPKFKNADSEELEYEVRSRYKMDEWSEDGAEETNEVRKIMSKRMEREALQFRSELIEKQNLLKFIKSVDPKIAEQAAQERDANLKEWTEVVVPEIVSKIPKLSTVLTDKDGKPTKEAFDYVPEKGDVDEVVRIAKSMGSDSKGFWGQFLGKDGKFDHTKLVTMMMRDRGYDKAVRLAREQGRAVGTEEGIKSIKGIDFNPDKRAASSQSALSMDEATAKSLRENL